MKTWHKQASIYGNKNEKMPIKIRKNAQIIFMIDWEINVLKEKKQA